MYSNPRHSLSWEIALECFIFSNIHVLCVTRGMALPSFIFHSDPMQKVTKFDKIYFGGTFGEVSLVMYCLCTCTCHACSKYITRVLPKKIVATVKIDFLRDEYFSTNFLNYQEHNFEETSYSRKTGTMVDTLFFFWKDYMYCLFLFRSFWTWGVVNQPCCRDPIHEKWKNLEI
jgi:hypothetical protein